MHRAHIYGPHAKYNNKYVVVLPFLFPFIDNEWLCTGWEWPLSSLLWNWYFGCQRIWWYITWVYFARFPQLQYVNCSEVGSCLRVAWRTSSQAPLLRGWARKRPCFQQYSHAKWVELMNMTSHLRNRWQRYFRTIPSPLLCLMSSSLWKIRPGQVW